MADYIPYTTDEMQPEAPATALHFARWFQNWEAGFAGAAGAPRMSLDALGVLAAGNTIRFRNDATIARFGSGGAQPQPVLEWAFAQAGTIRVSYEAYGNYSAYCSSKVLRWRGGVSTEMASFTETTAWQARTVDVPVIIGDVVEVALVAESATNPASTTNCRNRRLKTSGAYLWPGVSFQYGGTME